MVEEIPPYLRALAAYAREPKAGMGELERKTLLYGHLKELAPEGWAGLIVDLVHGTGLEREVEGMAVRLGAYFCSPPGHGNHQDLWPETLADMRQFYEGEGNAVTRQHIYEGNALCLAEALEQRACQGTRWGDSHTFSLAIGVEEIVRDWEGGREYFATRVTSLGSLSRTFDPHIKEGFENPRERLAGLVEYLGNL